MHEFLGWYSPFVESSFWDVSVASVLGMLLISWTVIRKIIYDTGKSHHKQESLQMIIFHNLVCDNHKEEIVYMSLLCRGFFVVHCELLSGWKQWHSDWQDKQNMQAIIKRTISPSTTFAKCIAEQLWRSSSAKERVIIIHPKPFPS